MDPEADTGGTHMGRHRHGHGGYGQTQTQTQTHARAHGCMDGRMDAHLDGRIGDGRIDWIDIWTDERWMGARRRLDDRQTRPHDAALLLATRVAV